MQPNPLRSCYSQCMRSANKAINDHYARKLEPTGVAVVQFSMLYSVGQLGRCGVCELAEAVGLDYSTVARSIKPLIERGLLADESDSRARQRQLTLTEAGRHTVETGVPLWEQAQRDVRELLGADEVEHLRDTLSKLERMTD